MSLRISSSTRSVLNEREGGARQSPNDKPSRQEGRADTSTGEEPAVIAELSDGEPDESERQFRRTLKKIREIEDRARHTHRTSATEEHCSFCNRAASQAGPLCQPDHVAVFICRECAASALSLLQAETDDGAAGPPDLL